MSAQEFENRNYGGSLYLAGQAQSLVTVGMARLRGVGPGEAGEVRFSLPVPLLVLRTSNVREGPGRGFKVLYTLREGALLVGQAFKQEWVRIRLADGRSGWIFHALVGSQPVANP